MDSDIIRPRRSPDEILDMVCSPQLTPKERRSRLQEECHDDPALERAVLKMLKQWERDNPEAQLEENSTVAGRYHLQRRLGIGTTATVWLAYDNDLQREVALKVFFGGSLGHHWKEVKREACAVAAVESDYIVRVNRVSEEQDHIRYIDLQLCRSAGELGLPVRSLREVEPSSLEEAVSWIAQAARGLHAAHRRDVFHRDMKPANLLVEPDRSDLRPGEFRRVHVTDFGLAVQRLAASVSPAMTPRQTVTIEMTDQEQIAGTPAYMAPEQARGLPRDMKPQQPGIRDLLTRIDIYGLGATLYELLAGRPPYESSEEGEKGAWEVMEKVKEASPAPLRQRSTRYHVPEALERIVKRAMAAESAHRHASALALAEDLEHWLNDEPTLDDEHRYARRAWLWVRRNPARVSQYSALAVLVLLGGAIFYFTGVANTAREDAKKAGADAAVAKVMAKKEIDESQREAKEMVERIRREAKEESERVRQEEIERGKQQATEVRASVTKQKKAALAALKKQQEAALAALKKQQEAALAELNMEWEKKLNAARAKQEAALAELNREWENKVTAATKEQEAALKREQQAAVAALNKNWEEKMIAAKQEQEAALKREQQAAVAALNKEWEEKMTPLKQAQETPTKEPETPKPAQEAVEGSSTPAT